MRNKKIAMLSVLAAIFFIAIPAAHAGVEISEFMAVNDTVLATAAGLYEDWIEIHNDSGAAEDLAGWYLTDDPADLRKWQFPSTDATSSLADDGYLIVFADNSDDSVISNELHASFKLGSGGEYLALIEPDGETVAYQYTPEYPDQSADISYGIDTGAGDHAYFAVPTPGMPNGQAIADSVLFSVKGGTFTAPFNLELSVPSPTAEIRYTLDGTLPTVTNALYSSSIPISGTTQVRARSFDSGLTDGAIVSQTYIHLDASVTGFSSDLPLVVVDTFGAGEIPHPDENPERQRQPSELVIFEPIHGMCSLTNSPVITSRAGIRRRGESTGGQAKPNLSVETWGEVDEDSRSIKPFGMPAESDWILYAPFTIDTALMRNPFIYEVSNKTGNYAVRTRFVEVFLNVDGGSISASDYFGVYVFMEKIKVGSGRVDIAELEDTMNSEPELTGGYIWKKDKADSTNAIDNFTAAGVPMPTKLGDRVLQYVSPSGEDMTQVQRNWLTNHINAIDALIPYGNYESMIDVTAFADHHILNVFANNADGLGVSTFYHKDRGGLVKMGPAWDFDRSMGCDNDARASDPATWGTAGDPLVFFHNGGRLWFDDLSRDPEFWIVWVDRWQTMRDGPLSDAAMTAQIEGYRTEISSAAERNYVRWPGLLNTNAWSDATTWSGKVDGMLNHVLTRGQWIDDQLVDPPVFNQDGGLVSSGFQLSMTEPQPSYYTLDNSDPRASGGSPAGSAYGSPITITENTRVKARAWNGQSFTRAPAVWPWSPLSEAMFVVDPAPLAITEIMYHPRPPSTPAELAYTASDFEFIEIQNTSASSCLLVGVQLLNGVEFDLTDASSDSLNAGQYGVLVHNLEAFKIRYPSWASLNILGTYSGRLNDGGEQMKMGYGLTNLLPLASFDYEDDWYPSTDGEGFSLVLDDPQSDPSTWDSKQAWRPSSAPDGTPGQANPAPAYPQGTIVINEVLSHQDTDNPGDWIELHNTTASPIDINGWFLSDSRGNLKKYAISGAASIPANGYIVFNEHDHFGSAFALSEHGDGVYLSAGNGSVLSEPAYREFQDFGAQDRDITFGRHLKSDGSYDFSTMASPTMGAVNSGPQVGPVVIDEIMYHPPIGGHEYVEIRNTSSQTVSLYDTANPSNVWKVSGIDFTFPMGVELTAHDDLLLIRDTLTPAQFRSIYGVPASVEIFSYTGALDNDADTVVLKKPGAPEAATGYVPYIAVEQVKYNDSAPWPLAADGLGKALVRINRSAYANDSANWQAGNAAYVPAVATLIVHSGSGDGAYTSGTVVPIVADTPSGGQLFVEWIGNVAAVADVGNPSTTVSMPGQDTTLTALYSSHTVFIPEGAEWNYHDQGQDLGTAWRQPGYDDSGWPSGPAQLGYGNGGAATTVVGYGGDPDNKYITTYFRKTFTVDDPSVLDSLTLRLVRDDGAVVYINGTEVARDNMPANPIDYQTVASSTVGGAAESAFYEFPVSPSVLNPGSNVLAVEIHQREPDSSDISFNAELSGISSGATATSDGDDDGLYDAWEVDQFGSTEQGLPDVDSDGDGFWNIEEFIAGTLPMDSNSYFRIDGFDGANVWWTEVSGRTYSVHWTEDLDTPFVPVSFDAAGGTYTDTSHPTNSAGFYQITVEME